ncbi:MAG: VanW family protein [Thermoclostridium sp.]|nr:VanW family protein [Thermoclostridium sp.]
MLKKFGIIFFFSLMVFLLSACPGKETETPKNTTLKDPGGIQSDPLTLGPTLTGAPSPSAKPKDPNEIADFSTEILNNDEDRVHNIKIAAEDINHTILEPDEVFSFNEIIGRRTEPKGYEEAPILLGNGEKGEGTGGGICQVSTTLYNAALMAELKIVERHRHSEQVPYVEEGKDATVVYNSKDLRFQNNRDYPIEIVVWVGDGEVCVKLMKKQTSDE